MTDDDLAALEAKAGVTRAELRDAWRVRFDQQTAAAVERIRDTADVLARRALAAAVGRHDGVTHLERAQFSRKLEPDTLALYNEGRLAAVFLEETGATLACEGETATVRSDDPLAREIGRRVFEHLKSLTSEDALRKKAQQSKAALEKEIAEAALYAVRELDLEPLPPEVARLVGCLKFRSSYSQSQWRHSIEVGHLAGLLAAELGLDVGLARRGGLLHDIGKAMTREGPHALLGAEVARKSGESEVIANCIGSHHDDEPMQTPLAYVVTAADALSGGRPGARRDNAEQYFARLADIQRIVTSSSAVLRVDIMQAGREVRVFVAGEAVAEAEMAPLAQRIARQLEDEVIYAGQIRVTVIRESRAVSIAR